MNSRPIQIVIAFLFISGVLAYLGMLAGTFGHVRGSYVRAFVLAFAVAVAMGRGNQFSLWLAAVLAACGPLLPSNSHSIPTPMEERPMDSLFPARYCPS